MSERLTMSLYNAQQAHQAIKTAWHHAKGWLTAGDTRLTLEGKNGIADLEKARHFLDLLIELEKKQDGRKHG